jgi:hypothetical protein
MTGMIQKWPANGCFLETLPNMFWGLPRWSDADFQVKCCFLNTAAGYYLYPEFPLDFWITAFGFSFFSRNCIAAPLFDLFRDPMSFKSTFSFQPLKCSIQRI